MSMEAGAGTPTVGGSFGLVRAATRCLLCNSGSGLGVAASCAVPYICTRMDESVSSSSRLSVTGWTNSASTGDGIGGLAAAVVDWWWCGWCKASGSVAFSYPCLNQAGTYKEGRQLLRETIPESASCWHHDASQSQSQSHPCSTPLIGQPHRESARGGYGRQIRRAACEGPGEEERWYRAY